METAATAFLTVVGHGLWGSALILGITTVCVRLLSRGGRLNATTRHSLWGACLLGIVLLHGALLASALSQPVSGGLAAALPANESVVAAVPDAAAVDGADTAAPAVARYEAAVPVDALHGADQRPPAAALNGVAQPAAGPTPNVTEQPAAVAPAADTQTLRSLQLPAMAGPIAVLMAMLWLVGVLFGLWRLAVAASRVQILKSQSTAVSSETRARILARVSPLRREMTIAVAPIGSPVAAGFRSPSVLMPEALSAANEEETFDQVALHEVAHIQRGDDWALLIQRIAEAVLWFNPAVRMAGNWMESEREAACDEWVVSATREPVSYARSLGRMIELRLVGSGLMAAPGLAAKESDIVTRVKALLEQGANATSREFRGRAAVAIGLVALVAVLSVLSAPSIEIDWRDTSSGSVQLASIPDSPGLPPLPPLPPLPSLAPIAPLAPIADRPAKPERPEPAPVADVPAVPEVPAVPSEAGVPSAPPIASVADVLEAPSTQAVAAAPLAGVQALGSDSPSAPAPALRTGPAISTLTVSGWLRFLKLSKGIPSEGDRARLLTDASSRLPSDQRVHAAFLDAARSIPSSSGKKRVLTAYLNTQSPQGPAALDLIRTAMTLPGSSDRSRMLVAIGQGIQQTAEIRSALLEAVDSLPSSSDRERVLRAMTN